MQTDNARGGGLERTLFCFVFYLLWEPMSSSLPRSAVRSPEKLDAGAPTTRLRRREISFHLGEIRQDRAERGVHATAIRRSRPTGGGRGALRVVRAQALLTRLTLLLSFVAIFTGVSKPSWLTENDRTFHLRLGVFVDPGSRFHGAQRCHLA